MSDASGLRRVLDRVAPAIRASLATGSFAPSVYATPLAVASIALESPLVVAVCATSTEADALYDGVRETPAQ